LIASVAISAVLLLWLILWAVGSVPAVPLELDRILATPLTGDTVGAPPDADTTIGEVGDQGWMLEDLAPPAVTLRRSAIEHNLLLMQTWIGDHRVTLFPHGKTTMAPQLWDLQLDYGAQGITAATPAQLRAMRSVGVQRVMLANELVDPSAIAWVARELDDEGWSLTCWVDSVEGVELLASGLRSNGAPRTLPVLVELGHEVGRTGARSVEQAMRVAAAVDRARELRLEGVAGYEGTIGHERTPAVLAAVDAFLGSMERLAERLFTAALVDRSIIVSAGGSLFFDRVAELLTGAFDQEREVDIVIRSGCTITHDHGMYERASPLPSKFRPAIEAWGSVLSRPEPEVVVIGLGKRDVPSDVDPPIPLRVRGDDRSLAGVEVVRLMDQHAICRAPAELALGPGDVVAFGISHPCTAFDRRRVLFVLDDDDHVVDAVATMF
jgi:D-serine deaminase-like pyridoxal phosphate-dependent protein